MVQQWNYVLVVVSILYLLSPLLTSDAQTSDIIAVNHLSFKCWKHQGVPGQPSWKSLFPAHAVPSTSRPIHLALSDSNTANCFFFPLVSWLDHPGGAVFVFFSDHVLLRI